MRLTTKEDENAVVLSLEGKLMGSPEEVSLMDMICELADKGKVNVVLDLSQLDWMNSRGLGMCVSGLTKLRSRGGDLRLVNPPDQLVSLMEKCHLYSLFIAFKTVPEAVASF